MILQDAFEMIERNETPEQYKKRKKRIKRLSIERDFLIDAIQILDGEQANKKQKRLEKILAELELLV